MKTVLSILLLIASVTLYAQGNAEVMQQLEVSYYPDFQLREINAWKKDVEQYSANQKTNGTWGDIDYSAVNSLDFSPRLHLSRAAVLAEAYGTPNQPFYKRKDLLPKIQLALDYWFAKDIQSYNWWHNEIGVQQYILRALVLTKGDLGKSVLNRAMSILARTEIKQTGQNLMWRSEIVFVRGLLTGNTAESARAAKVIEGILVFDQQEGIQSDGSFLQHGELIYNGGYGDKFVLMMSKFFAVVDGTIFDFKASSKQRFLNHVLDSQLWLTRNNKYDYGVMGRSLTIKNRTAANLGASCLALSKMKVKEKSRLANCADAILNNRVSGVEGNKAYYRSDFAVQQEKEYFASIRMYSTRTINNDAPSNGEGLMSHHLADGAMMLMKDGTEYENIFPVWDWNKVPGTTVEQKKIIPAQYIPGRWDLFEHMRFMGQSNFVGSVSNSRYGASSFNFISNPMYDSLKVKKSWFFFDQAIFAMGAGISCPGCEVVMTTLNQTLSKGDVKLIDSNRNVSLLTSEESQNDLFAVFHQNVGYVFPSEQQVNVSNKNQKGDWRTINSSLKSEIVSAKVFTAAIEHGQGPTVEKYEYIVLPEITEQALKAYQVKNNFLFLNSEAMQAVFSKKQNLLQVAAYEKGSFSLAGHEVTVSAPCLVMVQFKDGNFSVIVSDPTQMLKSAIVEVDGKKFVAQFDLGAQAGASVVAK